MISPLPCSNNHAVVLAGSEISPAIRTDHNSDSGRVTDPDEQRDYADQGPPSDSDLDGDTQILATLLKHIPECIDAADIELLLQDIPVQPPVVIPARSIMMQEAIQAEDMEVYLTVLRAHSREGHLQYLLSLIADLSTAAQDEGDGGEESEAVAGSCIDKEGEAGACDSSC
jgi:hypothetical protein